MNPFSNIHPSGVRRTTLIVLNLFLTFAPCVAADEGTPQAVVERLHATLLEAMTGGERLGFAGRIALIGPVVDDSFDFNTIARIVTGRYWKDASNAQRDTFRDVFRTLSAATYATNFSGFSGERFETIGTEEGRAGTVVKTELIKSDGEKIPLNYMLRNSDSEWRIVNVVAKGISDLSLKRADYTAVIQSEGFDSLLGRLQDKVDDMRRGS